MVRGRCLPQASLGGCHGAILQEVLDELLCMLAFLAIWSDQLLLDMSFGDITFQEGLCSQPHCPRVMMGIGLGSGYGKLTQKRGFYEGHYIYVVSNGWTDEREGRNVGGFPGF